MHAGNEAFVHAMFHDKAAAERAVQRLIDSEFATERIGALMLADGEVSELPMRHKTGIGPGTALGALLGTAVGLALPGLGLIALGPAWGLLGTATWGGATGALAGIVGGIRLPGGCQVKVVEELDVELQDLLAEHVNSHEKLDLILLVRGRAQPVYVHELARALRASASQVEHTLAALCASGLLVRHAGEQVRESARESMRRAVDALALAYAAQPLAVLAALSRQAIARVRRSPVRARASRAFARHARRQSAS
ncbi:MAG TPA: hypothetical protein VJR89_06005 [Polyangiales bacterium]|nr:hypothetical protein [Polyangiales bacterium]